MEYNICGVATDPFLASKFVVASEEKLGSRPRYASPLEQLVRGVKVARNVARTHKVTKTYTTRLWTKGTKRMPSPVDSAVQLQIGSCQTLLTCTRRREGAKGGKLTQAVRQPSLKLATRWVGRSSKPYRTIPWPHYQPIDPITLAVGTMQSWPGTWLQHWSPHSVIRTY